MNVTVLGLWHLGSVTAACCAKHFEVVGLDFDAATVSQLNAGQAPLLEPGLNELIASGLASKKTFLHHGSENRLRQGGCALARLRHAGQ